MEHENTVHPDPIRFAFVYDGRLVTGDLRDWAKRWEADYYAGDEPPPLDVLTWDGEDDPVRRRIKVVRSEPTENDYIPYTFTLPGCDHTVRVMIDGRS